MRNLRPLLATVIGLVVIAAVPASANTHPADGPDIEVTDANLQDVIDGSRDKPVVLDFSTTWCGICKMEAPFLQKWHDADKSWTWAHVDADAQPAIKTHYDVRGFPTLVGIAGGNEDATGYCVGFDKDDQSCDTHEDGNGPSINVHDWIKAVQ